MTGHSVEERLTMLEKAVADLQRAATATQPKDNWIERVAGSFRDDPEFGEVLRLGREIRKTGDT